MKKKLIFICIFILFLQQVWAEHKSIPKEYSKPDTKEIEQIIRNRSYYKIINEFDNYEPIPKDTSYKYIKIIPDNDRIQYKTDMNRALKHILKDKITYNNKTLKQMLLDFDRDATNIYKKHLKNKNNTSQNKKFLQKLNEWQGTISLYPNVIAEELKYVIDKYDLNLVPGSECDILIYKYYIEKYDIALALEFKTLLIIKQTVYSTISNYILEISDKI